MKPAGSISVDCHIKTRDMAMDLISESESRLTSDRIEKIISQKLGADKKTVQAIIRSLVENNEIAYTYHFGCSFLEKSMNRPVRISSRIILKPSHAAWRPSSTDVVINLEPGASFGAGDHPSTRLALRGIETILSGVDVNRQNNATTVLDIGTGSGILAIAAVLLGISKGVGIDTDPCAIFEAKKNVQLNLLENRIQINHQRVETIGKKFFMITANLRYPTLKRLCPILFGLMARDGGVVISGIKTDEVSDVLDCFSQNGFRSLWMDSEKNWAGLAFVAAEHKPGFHLTKRVEK